MLCGVCFCVLRFEYLRHMWSGLGLFLFLWRGVCGVCGDNVYQVFNL